MHFYTPPSIATLPYFLKTEINGCLLMRKIISHMDWCIGVQTYIFKYQVARLIRLTSVLHHCTIVSRLHTFLYTEKGIQTSCIFTYDTTDVEMLRLHKNINEFLLKNTERFKDFTYIYIRLQDLVVSRRCKDCTHIYRMEKDIVTSHMFRYDTKR